MPFAGVRGAPTRDARKDEVCRRRRLYGDTDVCVAGLPDAMPPPPMLLPAMLMPLSPLMLRPLPDFTLPDTLSSPYFHFHLLSR